SILSPRKYMKNREVILSDLFLAPSAVAGPMADGGRYPMSLKLKKGLKYRGRERCKAKTKVGRPCQAAAVEGDLCFCHAHPEKLAELGRLGGQKNRRWKDDTGLPSRPLKSVDDISELLEETINRVRQGPFDLRAATTIGFLAGIHLKA